MPKLNNNTPACSPPSTVCIEVDGTKAAHLQQLSTMSVATLELLAELSRRPGVEQKLQAKKMLLKTFI